MGSFELCTAMQAATREEQEAWRAQEQGYLRALECAYQQAGAGPGVLAACCGAWPAAARGGWWHWRAGRVLFACLPAQ